MGNWLCFGFSGVGATFGWFWVCWFQCGFVFDGLGLMDFGRFGCFVILLFGFCCDVGGGLVLIVMLVLWWWFGHVVWGLG